MTAQCDSSFYMFSLSFERAISFHKQVTFSNSSCCKQTHLLFLFFRRVGKYYPQMTLSNNLIFFSLCWIIPGLMVLYVAAINIFLWTYHNWMIWVSPGLSCELSLAKEQMMFQYAVEMWELVHLLLTVFLLAALQWAPKEAQESKLTHIKM